MRHLGGREGARARVLGDQRSTFKTEIILSGSLTNNVCFGDDACIDSFEFLHHIHTCKISLLDQHIPLFHLLMVKTNETCILT